MNYRNTLIAAAVAALVPLAGTALANDSHKAGKAGASFDALDTNRDGRISRAEASADSKIVFAQADANGDGYIDTMEYAKAKKSGDSATSPEPQSKSSSPNDASGQQTEPVTPQDPTQNPSTTPPTDTETPRQ
jgi:Ca2+-binding EF-hand superfamily protein